MQAAREAMNNLSMATIKNSIDEVRAQVYPRNETERKVYEALSSKNWGASTTLMNSIAGDTGDYEKFGIIMSLIWSNIENDGKSWKQVFKALTLIEFLVKNGSELVIEACRDKVYKVRSLENFNFYEGTVDRGSGVREKSKQIVELLGSNEMIKEERTKANNLRNKFVGLGNDGSRGSTGSVSQGSNYSGSGGGGNYGNQNSYSDSGSNRGGGGGQDSYSSNSNSRDSRYGNDNDKYSSGGGDNYSRGGGSSNYSNGGGSDGRYRDESAYPTETKKKTYDDEPEEEVKIKHKIKSSSKLAAPSSDTAIGGKLKLNIKKEGKLNISNSVPSNQPVAQEIDLLGGGESDFVPAPASSAIDPFSSQQQDFGGFSATPQKTSSDFGDFSATPQNNTPIQQQDFGFASFEGAPQAPPVPQFAPQTAPAFDPFAMNNTPPQVPKIQPQMQQPMQFSQPQQQTQQPNMMAQQGFDQFSSPMQSPQVQPMQPMQQQQQPMQQQQYQPQQSMNNFTPPPIPQSPPQQQYQQHQQPQQQQQQPTGMGQQQQPNSMGQQQQPNTMNQHQQQQPQQPQQVPTRGIVKAPEPVYGDFESSNPAAPSAAQPGKWGDLGSLVNLGSLSKDVSLAKAAAQQAATPSNYTPSSFAGLDGFGKSQSMSAATNSRSQMPMNQQQPSNHQPQSGMGAMGGGMQGQQQGGGGMQGGYMQGQQQPNGMGMNMPPQQQYGGPQGQGPQGQGQFNQMGMHPPQGQMGQGQMGMQSMQQPQGQQMYQQGPQGQGQGRPQGQGMGMPTGGGYGYPQGPNGNNFGAFQ